MGGGRWKTLGEELKRKKWPEVKYYTFSIYLLKVSNRNIRLKCDICSKLTTKRHQNDAGWVVPDEPIKAHIHIYK